MRKRELIFIILILLCAFVLRLYKFNNPIADWHSWRQADTSSVSRNFVKNGFDVLRPTFHDLSNVPSGFENPKGYRFVEFPLYNVFQGGAFVLFDFFSLEQWGRLVTIFSSLASIVFLYLLLKKYASPTAGLFTAFFYAVLPYNIYFGRVILPDPSMVAAILAGFYYFDRYLATKEKIKYLFYVFSFICTTAAFLLKPYAVFFLIPFLYVAWKKFGREIFFQWQLLLFAILTFLPVLFWRQWMLQYPEGIPVNDWLLNGNGIRFRPAFFRWIVYERIIKLISGYAGFILLLLGVYQSLQIKNKGFFLSFTIASTLYVTIFATGNVQHDYYQILLMPTLAMFFGLGAAFLFSLRKRVLNIPIGKFLLLVLTLLGLYFSWQQVKGNFIFNNSIVIAGEAVDRLTPKDAKVIANLTGDTSFLYQTRRSGWASFEHSLPEMIKLGADYLVLANPTQDDISFKKDYKIVSQAKEYILFQLH